MSKEALLRAAFTELAKAEKAGDWERGLKTANRILKTQQNSKEAFRCKIVSLIQLEKFPEALTAIEKAIPKLQAAVAFEKAYAQYRENKAAEALKTLDALGEDGLTPPVLELKGQLLYRLERFAEARPIYQRLLKETGDEFEDLRTANLMAVEVQLAEQASLEGKRTPLPAEPSYEQLYNAGCADLAAGDVGEALGRLRKAEAACRASLAEEEDLAPEETEEEAALIRVQLAYAHLCGGEKEKAAEIFQAAANIKPRDPVVAAVAAIGLVATKGGETNLFDTRKKLKSAAGEKMEAKLSRAQRKVVAYNAALLHLHASQFEPCRKALAELREDFGAEEESLGLEVALAIRQKDPAKAKQLLDAWKAKVGPANFPRHLRFAEAHLELAEGGVEAGIAALADAAVHPGPLSLIVALRLGAEDSKGAAAALDKAMAHWRKAKGGGAVLERLMEETAALKLRLEENAEAAVLLEELRKRRPDDPSVLASLIQAYAKSAPGKAEEVSSSLASLGEEVGGAAYDFDLDALEAQGGPALGQRGYRRKEAKPTPKAGPGGQPSLEKRKKKRRIRLPKNLDPNSEPDPERWLPRYERSAYKKRKDKRKGDREIGRGAQGAVSAAAESLDMSGKPSLNASASPASPKVKASPNPGQTGGQAAPGPRQQRPGGQAKAKKKPGKKGAGKW